MKDSHTFTACSADFLEWSTCSTLLNSLYIFKGKVATSPMAYTPGTLVSKKASVCMKILGMSDIKVVEYYQKRTRDKE
jgi:hypothetical protein